MLQVPSCHDDRVQVLYCCDVHLTGAFMCAFVVDAELLHTIQGVFRIDCSAVANENRDESNVVIMGEALD